MRLAIICTVWMVACDIAFAADATQSAKAIAEAVKLLETRRDAIADPIEKARVDKAIRELELLIDDSQSAPSIGFEVNQETLKKKFAGKAIYDPKSGELTLKYDFAGKAQLADFDVGNKRVLVTKKLLGVEAGDDLVHIAKFQTFQASCTMAFKSMNGPAIGSTAGTGMGTGGDNRDTIYLAAAGGQTAAKIAPDRLRRGCPIVLDVSPHKVSLRYGTEVLTTPVARPMDIHQIKFHGGPDGCGVANLVIVGIPDPVWFKAFLAD